jgi:hypothetical protein
MRSDTALPVRNPRPVGQVPCEETRCETCGEIVAFLIFADEAADDGRFEDFARLMYPHYVRHNVPTSDILISEEVCLALQTSV